jgi:hypothetical protein
MDIDAGMQKNQFAANCSSFWPALTYDAAA